MAETRVNEVPSLVARRDQPLIGVLVQENSQDVRYFTEEDAADAMIPQSVVQEALSANGAWSDLDWTEMEAALDKIRHDTAPTPPIEL